MKKLFKGSFISLLIVLTLVSLSLTAYAASYYIHDPMENPKAAADIIVDPNAVYGYSPDPDSARLGSFAQYDWSDKAFVESMKQEREEYHESIKELYQIKADMEASGSTVEEIARAVSTRRNEIRLEAYKDDPEGLEKLKESNLKTFGNENGGTPDYFYQKYGSWETVIEKAFSANAGADAILGLYDKYYDTYIISGDTNEPPTERGQNTAEETVNAGASLATEPPAETLVSPTDQAADRSMRSPQTGDRPIILFLVVMTMTGAAVICFVSVKQIIKQR